MRLLRRRTALAGTVLLALLVGPSFPGAPGATAAPPPRPRIVNGVFDHGNPAVGMLLTGGTPSSATMQCSGTMVGCRTFVTAAHCVCDAACQGADTPDPTRYFVYLQHAGVFAAARVVPHPDYGQVEGADIAVIELATPVEGVAPVPVNTIARPAFGSAGTIVGFGRTGGGDFGYGIKRAGAIVTNSCAPDFSDADWLCWAFEDPIGGPGSDSNTCNGDSGGPLLADLGSGPVLAGVTSGGANAACLTPDHSNDTDVFTHRDFIASVAGSDLDATSCGCLHQVGSAQTDVLGFDDEIDAFTPEVQHEIVVPAGTGRLRVALNAAADFDLYVRAGALATPTTFDCAATGSTEVGACEFVAPVAGSWFALVRRTSGSGRYQLTATLFDAGGREGEACDDGNQCTGPDACSGDACLGTTRPDGASCFDDNPCTSTDACQAGVCVGATVPRAGCRQPVQPGSRLEIRDPSGTGRDRLDWRWRRGEQTNTSDFGDPLTGDPLDLCVYRETGPGTSALATWLHVPAGPGWRAIGSGFRWSDRGSSASGVKSIRLAAGAAGRSSISLSARGPLLPLPALPIDPAEPVTVQFLTGGACFETRFPAPRQTSDTRFLAIGD